MPPKKSTSPPVTLPNVGLQYPAQYVVSMMANRYSIMREDGFIIVNFGLLGESGSLIDRTTCVLPQDTLEKQKENLVQYSEALGQPKKKIPSWNPVGYRSGELKDALGMPVVDVVHLCNWDDKHAEICFWNYSQGSLADLIRSNHSNTKNSTALVTWGVALVRCSIDLQRDFLIKLYDE